MLFERLIQWKDKELVLRNAMDTDAQLMIDYIKKTTMESRNLVSELDEIKMTVEDEIKFINKMNESPNEILLAGFIDGVHIGNGSIHSYGSKRRYLHRCSLGIALYQEYCNQGFGSIIIETLLEISKSMGYEQVELEVVTSNLGAIHLYEKYGFITVGTLPKNMKYSDGTYVDVYAMVKNL